MDFTFSDEQQQLRRSVREFAEGEILPHVMEWDEASHFPTEIMPKLGDMGLLGVIFPDEYGGAGLRLMEHALLSEELGRTPSAKDLDERRGGMPSKSLYWHTFGSFAAALQEAGFDVAAGQERLERAVRIVDHPHRPLVEVRQEARKDERSLRIFRVTPFGPSDIHQPPVPGAMTGRSRLRDMLHDDVGIQVGLPVRHGT